MDGLVKRVLKESRTARMHQKTLSILYRATEDIEI